MPLVIFFIIISLCFTEQTQASPIGKVGGAKVTKGLLSSEFRMGFTADDAGSSNDSRLQIRQHLDYGFTDQYALRIITQQDKRSSQNFEHSRVTFENRFHLITQAEYGWDGGIRLVYSHSDGDKLPHSLALRLQAEVPLATGWQWRHATIAGHAVGAQSRSGMTYELRNSVHYTLPAPILNSVKTKIGAELFNDVGRLRDINGYHAMQHEAGVIAILGYNQGIGLLLDYRRGISQSAADHTVAFHLQKRF